MATQINLLTAEEFLRLPKNAMRRELVKGELREMTPAGYDQRPYCRKVHLALGQYVEEHHLSRHLTNEFASACERIQDAGCFAPPAESANALAGR